MVWFEEPVSSDDLAGLRLIRDRAPPGMDIAAGEYGYDAFHFRDLLDAGAVDVLQADATRCCGITGLLQADALAWAANVPLSIHCAPALHLQAALCLQRLKHLEWFHDHVRIESMLLDGAPWAGTGALHPAAPDAPGPRACAQIRRRRALPGLASRPWLSRPDGMVPRQAPRTLHLPRESGPARFFARIRAPDIFKFGTVFRVRHIDLVPYKDLSEVACRSS